MGGLSNILSHLPGVSNSLTWERHQRDKLQLAVDDFFASRSDSLPRPMCEPLYPGSMLLNHLCVSGSGDKVDDDFPPRLDSLDDVYEALTVDKFQHAHHSIYVDCAVSTAQNNPWLEKELHRLLSENEAVSTLVVWSNALTKEFVSKTSNRKIDVIKINPQWHSPAYMLALFRSVTHCVFVDTQRVVDAIVTCVPCTLIASAGFSAPLKTTALQRTVMDADLCKVYWAESSNDSHHAGYTIVENRMVDLHAALRNYTDAPKECVDWLSAAKRSDGEVVITAHPLQWLEMLSEFRDRRVLWRKKWQKLREDPRGFCVDSKQPGLRLIAKLLPPRSVVS